MKLIRPLAGILDLGSRTLPELQARLTKVEENIHFGEQHGAEPIFVSILRGDARSIRAELERRGNGVRPAIEPVSLFDDALQRMPMAALCFCSFPRVGAPT